MCAFHINDSKYKEYLNIDMVANWIHKLEKVKSLIDENPKSPIFGDNLNNWINAQKGKYDIDIKICKDRMKNPACHSLWTETINNPKYQEYLCNKLEYWKLTNEKVKAYINKHKKAPSNGDKNKSIKILGSWISKQKQNYDFDITKCKQIMKTSEIHLLWTETINNPKYKDYLIVDPVSDWKDNLEEVKLYITERKKSPNKRDKNNVIKTLGVWVGTQKKNYDLDIAKCQQIMKNPVIHSLWTETINNPKYKDYLPPLKKLTKKQTAIPIATTTTETTTPHHFPPPSEIGLLHKTYLKMRSDTLNARFKSEPQLWREYHATRKRNFATYDPVSIPSNQIIRELEKIQTKRRKVVVDMGCGEAPIAHHFQNKNDLRFTFHNYDHQSGGDPLIQEVDISALPLDDASVEIGIMSLALWGTKENCTQYIKEAYRVLESGGLFYISDSTKKWSPEPLTPENGGELLRTLLTENGFKIIGSTLGSPFCLFVCNKL